MASLTRSLALIMFALLTPNSLRETTREDERKKDRGGGGDQEGGRTLFMKKIRKPSRWALESKNTQAGKKVEFSVGAVFGNFSVRHRFGKQTGGSVRFTV